MHPVISSSAVTALNRHLWYLCSETVPLAFQSLNFSTVLNWEASNSAASWQSDSSRRLFWHWFRTLNFPTSITDKTRLGDSITTDSSFIKIGFLRWILNFWMSMLTTPGQPSFCCFQCCEQLNIAWCKTKWHWWSPWGHGFSLEAPRGQLVMSLALASEVNSSSSMLWVEVICFSAKFVLIDIEWVDSAAVL